MRPRAVAAAALLLLSAAAGWQATTLRVDNRLERWAGEDRSASESYRRFRELFGSDELVVVAVTGGDALAPAGLEAMLAAAQEIEAVAGVERVEGPPIVYRELFGAEDPEACAAELRLSPFYQDLFVGADGRTAGLVVVVSPEEEAAARRRIVRQLRAALEPVRDLGLEVHLAGSTVLSAALDRVSLEEMGRTLPVALLGAVVMLVVLLRSVRAAIVAVTCSGMAVVLTLGAVAAVGWPLDMIGTALPALLGVLALAGVIHLLRRYQDLRLERSTDDAVAGALDSVTRPCTLAAVTTALGFLSLAVSPMAPVRQFGVAAAFGLMASLATTLTVGPVAIRLLGAPSRPARRVVRVDRWVRPLLRRPRLVLAVAGMLALAAAAFLPSIRVQSNPLGFLPDDGETVRAYRTVGGRLTGFYTLEVVVDTPGPWWRPDVAAELDALEARLEGSNIVARVLSPLDVLRQANRWRSGMAADSYRLPRDAARAEQLVAGLAGGPVGHSLGRLVARDGRTVRLSAVVDEMDQGRFLSLVRAAREATSQLPEGYRGQVTGLVLQLVTAQERLLRTQLLSLGAALVVVLVAIGLGLRSARLAGLAVLPNALPILSAFAAMGVLGMPLDAATVMVASIALGIGVDDAVHLLHGLDRHRRDGAIGRPTVDAALAEVGPALVVTTATAVLGFAALTMSAFVPIRDFGLLSSLALVVALVADVVLVPAVTLAATR